MITTNGLARDTTAVVLAGGKGTRLGALTRHVCKPAVPFGGAYRSIDFTLSNCVNSGVTHVGVATQHKPESLLRHIDRVWRNVMTDQEHFITPWSAEQRAPRWGYRGTADAVFRNLAIIETLQSRLVLVLAGDHIYKMDYRPLLAYHCERKADVTIGCVEVPIEEAHQFGIMSVDDRGRICRFVEKPKTPHELPNISGRILASMGIYVFDAQFLGGVLRRDACSNESRHDFGCDILPSLIGQADVFAYPFRGANHEPGYWRDIGTPSAYWRAHLDLLGPSPSLHLHDPSWPLRTDRGALGSVPRYVDRNPAGTVESSVVASGCAIRGATVRRSVLFSDVMVSAHSDISESVILPGGVIGRHCRLRGVIVDSGCRIPDGTVIDRSMCGRALVDDAGPTIVTAEDIPANFARLANPVVREGAVA